MQKQETRPNTQYENMIQYQIRKVVIDPPKTQDLISNKYDIIPNPQSCVWPRHKTLYPMMMQKQNTNQKEYSMSIFCVKWKWKCGCLVRKYQCQHYHSVKMGISYQQHRIAIGCFNGRSLPSRRGELNPSAPSGVWQGLFLCHLVFSLWKLVSIILNVTKIFSFNIITGLLR